MHKTTGIDLKEDAKVPAKKKRLGDYKAVLTPVFGMNKTECNTLKHAGLKAEVESRVKAVLAFPPQLRRLFCHCHHSYRRQLRGV